MRAEPTEHTIAGKLFGCVQELYSGKPADKSDAEERARTNDGLAELAADTAAMVPGLKLWGAGALRAGLLIDPDAGLRANATSIALNLVEGMALQGCARLSHHTFTGLGKSSTLLNAGVSVPGLFAMGFTTGATKSIFHYDASTDSEFNVSKRLQTALAAGTTGGVIGVPAGIVGANIGQAGARSLAESGMPQRLSTMAISAGSGYASGAIFGAVEASRHGGSLWDIAVNAHESALIGSLAGGLTGGFVRLPLDTSLAPRLSEKNQLVARSSASRSGLLDMPFPMIKPLTAPEHVSLASESLLIPRINERPISERLKALGPYQQSTTKFEVERPGFVCDPVRHKEQGDFIRDGIMLESVKVRVYSVRGTQLVVPEPYARELDTVLSYRQNAWKASDPSGLSPLEAHQANEAAARLVSHPFRDRAHPIDILPLLEEVPDLALARQVVISDRSYPYDKHLQMTFEPGTQAAASASTDNVVTFYKPDRVEALRDYMRHEWMHLLKFRTNDQEGLAFQDAATLEDKKFISAYAKYNIEENWAEHGTALLHPDPDVFHLVTDMAPIKTAVIARAAQKSMVASQTTFIPEQALYRRAVAERLAHMDRHVLPSAISAAKDAAIGGRDVPTVTAGIRLLSFLDHSPETTAVLGNHAKTNGIASVRELAYELAWERVSSLKSYSGYDSRTVAGGTTAQVDFLLDIAQPGSLSRDRALAQMRILNDPRGNLYHDLFSLDSYQGPKLPKLFSILERMPDQAGREAAWQLGMSMTVGLPADRLRFAAATVGVVPAMRSRALDCVANLADSTVKPLLEEVARSTNQEWADKAVIGLKRIENNSQIEHFARDLGSPELEVRLTAIQNLGDSGDTAAVLPLLMAITKGRAERSLATHLLRMRFPEHLVHQQASDLVAQDGLWYSVLHPVLAPRYLRH